MQEPISEVPNTRVITCILWNTARVAAKIPELEFVQLNSFGCGIDAITTDQVEEILSLTDTADNENTSPAEEGLSLFSSSPAAQLLGEEALPSKYLPGEEGFPSVLPGVRDQWNETCWAHAAMTARAGLAVFSWDPIGQGERRQIDRRAVEIEVDRLACC